MKHCVMKSQFEPQPYPEQVGLSRNERKVFKIFFAGLAPTPTCLWWVAVKKKVKIDFSGRLLAHINRVAENPTALNAQIPAVHFHTINTRFGGDVCADFAVCPGLKHFAIL